MEHARSLLLFSLLLILSLSSTSSSSSSSSSQIGAAERFLYPSRNQRDDSIPSDCPLCSSGGATGGAQQRALEEEEEEEGSLEEVVEEIEGDFVKESRKLLKDPIALVLEKEELKLFKLLFEAGASLTEVIGLFGKNATDAFIKGQFTVVAGVAEAGADAKERVENIEALKTLAKPLKAPQTTALMKQTIQHLVEKAPRVAKTVINETKKEAVDAIQFLEKTKKNTIDIGKEMKTNIKKSIVNEKEQIVNNVLDVKQTALTVIEDVKDAVVVDGIKKRKAELMNIVYEGSKQAVDLIDGQQTQ